MGLYFGLIVYGGISGMVYGKGNGVTVCYSLWDWEPGIGRLGSGKSGIGTGYRIRGLGSGN